MGKFRKKPVVIDAWRVSRLLVDAANDWRTLPEPIRESYEHRNVLFLPDAIEIRTLEGVMRGDRADWIIQGVQGELYPCKPEIFKKTYEPVEEK